MAKTDYVRLAQRTTSERTLWRCYEASVTKGEAHKRRIRLAIVGNAICPDAILERLVRSTPHEVAVHPNTSQRTLVRLIRAFWLGSNGGVYRLIATNTKLHPEDLEALADHYPLEVAGNTSTPGRVVDELCAHKDVAVRRAAFDNPAASDEGRAMAVLSGLN